VRQAIAQVNGLSDPASSMIISRPVAGGGGRQTILPVDWNEIMTGPGATTTYFDPATAFVQPPPSPGGQWCRS
jgi:hypothetical protein